MYDIKEIKKYDTREIDTQSLPRKKIIKLSPPPCYPCTFAIPLSASCLIKISPLTALLTICFFFLSSMLNVGPKNTSPSVYSAF